MASQLSRACDRVIEAGWLAALVVTPLFFNHQSFRNFEPDKAALLQSIGSLVVVAWTVKGIEHALARLPTRNGGVALPVAARGKRRSFALPVLVSVLLFFLVYAAATAWSVDPGLSLRGSFDRLHGLYTVGAYFVLFLSVLALLRRRDQAERLITTAIVVSFPVAAYGVIQHLGLDPLVWVAESRSPVRSTLGNEIFVAAFLVMTFPLTLFRVLRGLRCVAGENSRAARMALACGAAAAAIGSSVAWWGSALAGGVVGAGIILLSLAAARILRSAPLAGLNLGVYTVILSVQLTCIVLSESRGPFLGLLFGLVLFALFWAQAHGRWRWNAPIVGCGLLILVVLAVINVPGSPLRSVLDVPVIGRLTAVFQTWGAGRVRILIWEGMDEIMTADPLRTAIGHGPETMRLVFSPHYRAGLGAVAGRDTVPDRAHNATFDALLTRGLLGLGTYYLLMISVMALVQNRLGALSSRRQGALFLACVLGCPAGLTIAIRLVDGSLRFAGIALSMGVLIGLVVYMVGHGLASSRAGRSPRRAEVSDYSVLLTVPLASALLAHFVESQFGIEIVSTQTLFWSLLALLVAIGRLRSTDPATYSRSETIGGSAGGGSATAIERSPAGGILSSTYRPLLTLSVVMALVMVTVLFDFSRAERTPAAQSGIFWLLILTFIVPALIVVGETYPPNRTRVIGSEWLERIGLCSFICLCSLVSAHLLLSLTEAFAAPPDIAVLIYPSLVLVVVGLMALTLAGEPAPPRRCAGTGALAVYLVLCLGGLYAARAASLNVILADVWFKKGVTADEREHRYDRAIEAYSQAVSLAPHQDRYYLRLGKALAEKALRSFDRLRREELLEEADKVLREAARLRPLDPDHQANLARLHKGWAVISADEGERERHVDAALRYYARATEMAPNRVKLWNEWGTTYTLIGDTALALEKYRRAVSLDPAFHETYRLIGNLHRDRGQLEVARKNYEKALRLEPDSVEAHRNLADLLIRLGRLRDAITRIEALLNIVPEDIDSYRNLLLLHLRLRDCRGARLWAERARERSPIKRALDPLLQEVAESCR